jgi:nucleotide-binding universal stress UspA family protein
MSQHPYVLLTAVDLEVGSSFVLQAALAVAAAHEPTDLHILAVATPAFAVGSDLATAPYAAMSQVDMGDFSRTISENIEEFRKREPRLPLLRVEAHRSIGNPADEIVWLAAHLNADRILLGSHNRRGLKRMLLGSVAEKVVRLAGCEVTVVRDKNHKAEWRVPEIEPVCPDCATSRQISNGAKLWCTRHSQYHVRAHVYSSAGRGPEGPHASNAMTGT